MTDYQTVPDLLAYADEHPDEVQSLLDAERDGQNRSTAVQGLEARLTVQEPENPEVPAEEETEEEDAPEGTEGVDWYRRDDGEVFRLDDGSDEYIASLVEEEKI